MSILHKTIPAALRKLKNPRRAAANEVSHSVKGYRALGLSSPEVSKVLREFRAEIKMLGLKKATTLAGKLASSGFEEDVLAGNFVLQIYLKDMTARDLGFLDNYASKLTSWSTTDDFCIDVLQQLFTNFPETVTPLLKKWNASPHVWKRRSSVVVFVRKVGLSGKHTKLALSLIENLKWDREDLIQKAVGWALKDLMRGSKKEVVSYVLALRKQGVPAIVTLYACRDLKGIERKRILSVKPEARTSLSFVKKSNR